MDIVSHGLWGGIAFGRKNLRSFWLTFAFGIMPDLLAFGPFFLAVLLGFVQRPAYGIEPPQDAFIPLYVHDVYNVTHSAIIFTLAFLLMWLLLRRPVWEMAAWGLHILFDIPVHTAQFFPTPFLWPLSSYRVNGVSWSHPAIFIPNVVLLAVLYGWFFIRRRRQRLLR